MRGVPLLFALSPVLLATLAAGVGDNDGPPAWRFRKDDRPVKVVVLAGSVGAYQKRPYHERLEEVCSAIEVQNLSKTGLGVFALKQRFKQQVLANSAVKPKTEGQEHWVLMAAGVNNLYAPESANLHLENIFALAHDKGYRTVALTPTPWGSADAKQHQGLEGLSRRDATQLVTDFVMGRLDAVTAFGAKAAARPEVAVDLYDSPLRDSAAEIGDVTKMRAALLADRRWAKAHAGDDGATRALVLEADAQRAAAVPQWFMKAALRGFDGVHPNSDGHRIVAQVVCPQLPANWSCDCAKL